MSGIFLRVSCGEKKGPLLSGLHFFFYFISPLLCPFGAFLRCSFFHSHSPFDKAYPSGFGHNTHMLISLLGPFAISPFPLLFFFLSIFLLIRLRDIFVAGEHGIKT